MWLHAPSSSHIPSLFLLCMSVITLSTQFCWQTSNWDAFERPQVQVYTKYNRYSVHVLTGWCTGCHWCPVLSSDMTQKASSWCIISNHSSQTPEVVDRKNTFSANVTCLPLLMIFCVCVFSSGNSKWEKTCHHPWYIRLFISLNRERLSHRSVCMSPPLFYCHWPLLFTSLHVRQIDICRPESRGIISKLLLSSDFHWLPMCFLFSLSLGFFSLTGGMRAKRERRF